MSARTDRFLRIAAIGVRPDRRSSAVCGGSFLAITLLRSGYDGIETSHFVTFLASSVADLRRRHIRGTCRTWKKFDDSSRSLVVPSGDPLRHLPGRPQYVTVGEYGVLPRQICEQSPDAHGEFCYLVAGSQDWNCLGKGKMPSASSVVGSSGVHHALYRCERTISPSQNGTEVEISGLRAVAFPLG